MQKQLSIYFYLFYMLTNLDYFWIVQFWIRNHANKEGALLFEGLQMLLLHVPDDVLLLLVLCLLVELGGLENLGGKLGDGVPGNLCRLNILSSSVTKLIKTLLEGK